MIFIITIHYIIHYVFIFLIKKKTPRSLWGARRPKNTKKINCLFFSFKKFKTKKIF